MFLDALRQSSRGPRLDERDEPDGEEDDAVSWDGRPISGACSWGGTGRRKGEKRGGRDEEGSLWLALGVAQETARRGADIFFSREVGVFWWARWEGRRVRCRIDSQLSPLWWRPGPVAVGREGTRGAELRRSRGLAGWQRGGGAFWSPGSKAVTTLEWNGCDAGVWADV